MTPLDKTGKYLATCYLILGITVITIPFIQNRSNVESLKRYEEPNVLNFKQRKKLQEIYERERTATSININCNKSVLNISMYKKTPCAKATPIDTSKLNLTGVDIDSFITSTNYGTKKTLMLMHIPKTGGTSIENSGLKHGILWGSVLFRSTTFSSIFDIEMLSLCQKFFNLTRCCGAPWHLPLKYWVQYYKEMPLSRRSPMFQFFDLEHIDYLCVVRNPFTRIISEYKYLLNRSNRMKFKPQRLFKEYGVNMKTKDLCTASALNQWIQISIGEFDKLACTEPNTIETHFYPQYEYIYDDAHRKICANIIRFEAYEEHMSKIMKQYHLQPVYESWKSVHDRKNAMCEDSGLGIHDLTANVKELIFRKYQMDFVAFNYSYPHNDLSTRNLQMFG